MPVFERNRPPVFLSVTHSNGAEEMRLVLVAVLLRSSAQALHPSNECICMQSPGWN